jgi:septal ring factor EnvC (AmiA/AmiB activator)
MEQTLAKPASLRRFVLALAMPLLAGLLAAGAPWPAAGQDNDAAARAAREAELEAIARDMAVTEERQAELRREIAALDKDRATLNQTLIDTGKRVQELEAAIDATEARIAALAANEDALHASLIQRRDVLAEVLAALQRMGHRPPPAILVRPEDALASVRSAILLGAVVPDLRAAADRLALDLKALVALKNEMAVERDRMRRDAISLAEERARIEMLLAEKREQRLASASALADEEKRAAALAAQATPAGRPRGAGRNRPRSAAPTAWRRPSPSSTPAASCRCRSAARSSAAMATRTRSGRKAKEYQLPRGWERRSAPPPTAGSSMPGRSAAMDNS